MREREREHDIKFNASKRKRGGGWVPVNWKKARQRSNGRWRGEEGGGVGVWVSMERKHFRGCFPLSLYLLACY